MAISDPARRKRPTALAFAAAASMAAAGCGPDAPPPVNEAVIANLATAPSSALEKAEAEEAAEKARGTPAPAIPAAFRGEWIRDLADCRTGSNETRLVVDANSLRFHESAGPVRRVMLHNPRAITVRVELTGEGMTRIEQRRMELSAHGESLTVDGFSRRKCRGA